MKYIIIRIPSFSQNFQPIDMFAAFRLFIVRDKAISKSYRGINEHYAEHGAEKLTACIFHAIASCSVDRHGRNLDAIVCAVVRRERANR